MSDRATIEAHLDSDDVEERRRAAAAIADLAGDDAVRLLLRALADADWRVRKEAAATAVALGPSPKLLSALLAVFEPGDDVGLRNAAVEALGALGGPAIDAIAAAVPRLDADGRKLAVDALARSADAEALGLLRILVADGDANVRAAAVEAIASVGAAAHDDATELLTRCVQSEDTHVRLAALDGLNRLEVPVEWDAISSLIDDPVLAAAAIAAAGRSRSSDAAPMLAGKLAEARGSIWQAALAALAGLARLGPQARADVRAALATLPADGVEKVLVHARAHEAGETTRAALLLGGLMDSDEAAGVAVSALADDRFAAEAEEALLSMGARAVPSIVRRIRIGRADERAACLALVSRIPDTTAADGVLDAVHDALDDSTPEVARAALGAIAQLGNESSLRRVAERLDAGAEKSLLGASESALAECAQRHDDAARALVRECAAGGSSKHAAVVLLGALDGPLLGSTAEDVAFLARALADSAAVVRRAAVDALASLSVDEAVEPVAFALTDEERQVRIAAVRALGRIRTDEGAPGVDRLVELVRSGSDDALVATAIRALGDTRDPRALVELRPIAREGRPLAAVSAVEALAALDAPKRIDALIDALAHQDAEVVKAALRALASQVDSRIVSRVAACADHPAWDVRRLAADLLGRAGGPVAEGLLRTKLSTEPEKLVRDAIQRALAELEAGGGKRRTVPPPGLGSWRP